MQRHTPEQVIVKLRQAEADLTQGLSIAQVCQKLGVSEQIRHRWHAPYGGNRCVRRSAEHKDHVWTWDFLHERSADGGC
jgi:transposase